MAEEIAPLSTWEKIKSGVVGFVKSVAHYIPRGILFSAAIFAGSAALGAIGLWDPLEIGTAFGGPEGAALILKKLAIAVGIGSAISGGLGAVEHITAESRLRDQQIMEKTGYGRQRAMGQEPVQSKTEGMLVDAQKHLPYEITAHKIIGL